MKKGCEILKVGALTAAIYFYKVHLVTLYPSRLRLDGVVRSPSVQETSTRIPYRASGDQFYRYKLLVDYLTSGESGLFPSESLSGPELCLLHEMISSTIDPWERGDEAETCIVTKMPGAAWVPIGQFRCIIEVVGKYVCNLSRSERGFAIRRLSPPKIYFSLSLSNRKMFCRHFRTHF